MIWLQRRRRGQKANESGQVAHRTTQTPYASELLANSVRLGKEHINMNYVQINE